MRIETITENTCRLEGIGAEHGLCIYIETDRHRLLMDAGASGLLLRNAAAMGIDLSKVDTVVISHGHYDHTDGLPAFAEINPNARIYIQKRALMPYYHGEKYIGADPRVAALPQLITVEGDLRIDEQLFIFSGITGRKLWPASNRELSLKTAGRFIQDDFSHEQCLVVQCEGRNILLSGCAHNGILNILDRYRSIFSSDPDIVISGFHMKKKDAYTEDEIRDIRGTARALKQTRSVFYTGHCTGAPAFNLMKDILNDQLCEMHAGEPIL